VLLLAAASDLPAARSRHVQCHVYDDSEADHVVAALVDLAHARPGPRRPLILTEEEKVAAVSAQRERLESAYILALPAAGVVTDLLHKDDFRAAAEAGGHPIPQTRRVRSPDDLDAVAALVPPLVVKPAGRQHAFLTHFARATRVESVAAAQSLLTEMLAVSDDLIVQEWIDGEDSSLYFCLQSLPANGGPPLSFVGRKLRAWPRQTGGTARCVAAPEAAAALTETTTRFFREQGVVGLAGMEYKWRATTQEFVMIEPTIGRTDYQEEIATLNGVNLPLAAYRQALGRAVPDSAYLDPPRIWKDPMADANAAAVDPAIAHPAPPGARVVDALQRAEDPMPGVLNLRDRVQAKLARSWRRRS
jgi:predicted ATP-grasp superfamily ATP-dependent carboligase